MFAFGLERWLIGIVLSLAVVFGAYQTGYFRGYNASQAEWAIEKAEINAAAKVREAHLRASGAELAAELESARAKVKIQTVEVTREVIKYVKVGRAAFAHPNIASLLNSMSGIRETVTREGPSGPVSTSREVGADPLGPRTSESALSLWIAATVDSHERCRLQANSLIEYAKICSGAK